MPDLASRAVRALHEHKLSVAFAESVTGGLLGGTLTNVPGCSDVYRGALVSYQDDLKAALLRVDRDVLQKEGAVHPVVARQMAQGVRELLGADIGVSTTGFAGPSVPPGGELGKVYIGLAHWGGVEVHEMHFPDERNAVREGAVREALHYLLEAVPKAAADAR